jgi:hypothetical protein
MTTLFARSVFIFVWLLLLPINAVFALEPGESIVLDPATGDYTLTYSDKLKGGIKVLSHATFCPSTKIVPTIESRFFLNQTGTVTYSYSVSSGAKSRQVLNIVNLDIVGRIVGSQELPTDIKTTTVEQAIAVLAANEQALATPIGWRGAISNYEGGTSISWNTIVSGTGIPPKGKLKGFGFKSQGLPGLAAAQLKGECKFVNGYGGEGPDPGSDIAKQIQELDGNDFVPRPAAVPTIAVPDPFDTAVLLDRIQAQMHTWIAMSLLDPVFSTQLDRSFQSAISAYRLNQPKVGMQEIQTMRKLIEKEQPDLGRDEEHESEKSHEKHDDRKTALIDRLAARVLDFDLAYVTKRMDDDEGEHRSARRHDR